MPTANCSCSEPEPLLHMLFGASGSCTQVDFPAVQALDDCCSFVTDFSSVDRLQDAFDENKVVAQTYFDLNVQMLTNLSGPQQKAEQELATLRAQHVALRDEKRRLLATVEDSNATHNDQMAH